MEHWIDNADSYICPICGFETNNPNSVYGRCPKCGFMDAKDVCSVDMVEVVRCKDCKHYDNTEGIQWCHLNSKFYPGGFDWHSFPEDGFCSYGERKDHG